MDMPLDSYPLFSHNRSCQNDTYMKEVVHIFLKKYAIIKFHLLCILKIKEKINGIKINFTFNLR